MMASSAGGHFKNVSEERARRERERERERELGERVEF